MAGRPYAAGSGKRATSTPLACSLPASRFLCWLGATAPWAGVQSSLQPPGPGWRSAHGQVAARAAAPGARRLSFPAPWATPCPARQCQHVGMAHTIKGTTPAMRAAHTFLPSRSQRMARGAHQVCMSWRQGSALTALRKFGIIVTGILIFFDVLLGLSRSPTRVCCHAERPGS